MKSPLTRIFAANLNYTKEVLSAYGFDIPSDLIPEKVELPSMEYLMKSVSEYLKKEHFAFPAEKSIQMGFHWLLRLR